MDSAYTIEKTYIVDKKQFYRICRKNYGASWEDLYTSVFEGDIVECEAWIKLHDAGYME